MTSRVLIVPAAGLGTRLGADRPKLLVEVGGVPMIDRLLALFAGAVDRAVVVVHSCAGGHRVVAELGGGPRVNACARAGKFASA